MRKQAPTVEWHITESDAEWERVRGAARPDSEPTTVRGRCLNRYCWGVAVLFLLLASADGWVWHSEQGRTHPAEAEITVTAHQELGTIALAALPRPIGEVTALAQGERRTLRPNDDPRVTSGAGDQHSLYWWYQQAQEVNGLRAAVQTSDPETHLDILLHTVELQGELATARIVTRAARGIPAYRQTRFYRRTNGGWVRTAPDAALWGPARSLETPYFVYHFRQNDAQAVTAVASQVDTLYLTLRRNFGLPLSLDAEKLVIDVSVTLPPGHVAAGFGAPTRFPVSSPAVYWAPVELTDAELLAQSIALPLLNYVLAHASEHHAIGKTWQPLLDGLYLWQVWDLDLPLAAWRADVAKWIYVDVPAIGPGQPVVLPKRYAALCGAHKLWLSSPMQIHIPIGCTELDGAAWYLRSFYSGDQLTHLAQLAVPVPQSLVREPLPPAYHPGQTVALATLIEYAVATYGRERLPALLAGLGQYESWDTLLPAVYGVSASEFEAGWQAYLVAHYGIISAN